MSPSTSATCAIDIRQLSKNYGSVVALKTISLQIFDNEFFTLLGPSGCGKTTILRLIAGFEEANHGDIFLFGEKIEKLPPHKRPVNTVFQNYALFPHMTVFDNVLFGLRMLNRPKEQATRRTRAMLELVQLASLADRYPAQLSGGQQQRVALARALAPEPKVLLLDESLSALDLKLRQAMRVELKHIQRETGITFIFVTHDQDEALSMSDRIAIMSEGRLQQVGSAREIYETPINRFVADFIGEVNLLSGKIDQCGAQMFFVLEEGGHQIAIDSVDMVGEGYVAAIRPEKVQLTVATGSNLRGIIEHRIYIGAITETQIRLHQGPRFVVRVHNIDSHADNLAVGQEVSVVIEAGAVRLLQK